MMRCTRQLSIAALLLFSPGCAATKTGNPVHDDPPPEGIELVRAALERDTEPTLDAADQVRFGEDSRDFALEFYSQVSSAEGNLFLSPYSLWAALGMLYAGAEGETKAEMTSALRFNLPEPSLYAAFNATALALAGRPNELAGESSGDDASMGDAELRVVNGAFTQRGFDFEEEYLETLARDFGAGVFVADFATQPERERLAINQWVEDQTESRIQDLLPPNSLDPMVRLILANAVYFKGSWLDPFDASKTATETFHAPGGDVQVPTMNGRADLYAAGEGYQALELPYIAPALRMLFVLPDAGRFAEIEAALNRTLFDQIRANLSRHSVTVKLPKFSFDSSIRVREALQAMGMQQAFVAGAADLTGIAPADLYVADIFHQAFIALDEQGTEAAAATAIIDLDNSAPPPADFFADRPFLFMIYDEPTGQILFLGRLLDPG
jgi:serpin B